MLLNSRCGRCGVVTLEATERAGEARKTKDYLERTENEMWKSVTA